MKKIIVLIAALSALAACEVPPQPQTQAQVQLHAACGKGNIQACAVLEQNRVRQEIANQQQMSRQFVNQGNTAYQSSYSSCNPNYYNSGVTCYNY